MEAEYIAQTHAAKESIWLCNFISKMEGKKAEPFTLNCDNQGAIALAKDNKFHSRTKHINLCYHFIREVVDNGKITMNYIPMSKNIVDIFTKSLARPKFEEFVRKLGLRELVGKKHVS